MNAKNSVFVIFIEAIIYLSLYNLHDCTFNGKLHFLSSIWIMHSEQNFQAEKEDYSGAPGTLSYMRMINA